MVHAYSHLRLKTKKFQFVLLTIFSIRPQTFGIERHEHPTQMREKSPTFNQLWAHRSLRVPRMRSPRFSLCNIFARPHRFEPLLWKFCGSAFFSSSLHRKIVFSYGQNHSLVKRGFISLRIVPTTQQWDKYLEHARPASFPDAYQLPNFQIEVTNRLRKNPDSVKVKFMLVLPDC